METRKPTAIVTSGGGMKCAYSAGALVALAEKFNLTQPDFFVSASGSVANMLYFLTGQNEDLRKIWTRYATAPGLVTYSPLPVMHIDYLIDTIFKEFLPLLEDNLQKSATKYFIPVTDVESGEARFLSKDMWLDPYEVMRAAKAIPILYNGHVHIGNHSYIDGNFSVSTAGLIKKALEEGAKRILLITNTEPPSKAEQIFLRGYGMFLHPNLRAHVVNDLIADCKIEWPEDVEFVLISPSYPVPIFLFSRNRRKVNETFNMGYDDLIAKRDEVEKLFL